MQGCSTDAPELLKSTAMTFSQRRSIRLQGYDYTQMGSYFITVVTHQRDLLFVDDFLRSIAEACWQAIPQHFPYASLDESVIMPNHVHGIIFLEGGVFGRSGAAPLPDGQIGVKPG